jgi:hypothetical protein
MRCEVFNRNEISDCYGFWRPGFDPRRFREICGTGTEFSPGEEVAGLSGSVTFMSINMAAMRTKPKLKLVIVTWHCSPRVTRPLCQ